MQVNIKEIENKKAYTIVKIKNVHHGREVIMLEKIKSELAKNSLGIHHQLEYFCSAVFLPLIETEEGLSILFEVRSHNLRRQPGEICFPGGKIEQVEFEYPAKTALRETIEELKVCPQQIDLLGSLNVMTTPTGMLIYPFVGVIREYSLEQFSKEEVERVFSLPLQFFLDNEPTKANLEITVSPDSNFPLDLIPKTYVEKWKKTSFMYPTYFYKLPDGSLLWGITARILLDFTDLYKKLLM